MLTLKKKTKKNNSVFFQCERFHFQKGVSVLEWVGVFEGGRAAERYYLPWKW